MVFFQGVTVSMKKGISESSNVTTLPIDTIVTVEEIDGARCRISRIDSKRQQGWVSMFDKDGFVVLEKLRISIGKYVYSVNWFMNESWLKECMFVYFDLFFVGDC